MPGPFRIMSPVGIAILCAISSNLIFPLAGVLHGTPTAPFEFPELARIYRCNFLQCTGIILNRQWVMTSAFCFVDALLRVRNLTDFFINVGDHNSSVRESSEQNLSVTDIVVHDHFLWDKTIWRSWIYLCKYRYLVTLKIDYDGFRRLNDYDIVLLRVQPDIKFGATVRPVNMPRCEQSPQPGVTQIKSMKAWASV